MTQIGVQHRLSLIQFLSGNANVAGLKIGIGPLAHVTHQRLVAAGTNIFDNAGDHFHGVTTG